MKIEERTYTMPDGTIAIIKSAGPEDAELIKKHREISAAETHFMARYPEDGEFNLDIVRGMLEGVEKSEKGFLVTAYVDGEIIGDLGVTLIRPHMKYLHRGYLGMSIREKYCSKGLGSFMMQTALDQARANGFEQVELGVFSDNDRARGLYKKFGFKEYGMNPRAFKLKDGTYRDEIIMVKIFD